MARTEWIWKEADPDVVGRLRDDLKIHPVLCRLLVLRGIADYDTAFHFFRPKLADLHDPFMMKDMDRAVNRIAGALDAKEHLLVYGDYDVDGTTAVALMARFLKELTPNVGFYQPDRYREGYGVSQEGIDYAADNGYSLIIALDCGIKAIDQVAYAAAKDIDFIICDHHLPGDALPEAVAVLDPKRPDCDYPYKELCGCGIGFKLAQALTIRRQLPENNLYDLMDLLAVSIAADIVPITGENRVMTHFGLQLLNSRPRIGISALLKTAGYNGTLTVGDLVFVIAPRINAAGRMEHASGAVEMLLEEDAKTAEERAAKIDENNAERKALDARITEEALTQIAADANYPDGVSTVVYDPGWHKGVIGIVASRLIETHYRPTVILTLSNGKVTGSARSVRGFDLYAALEACEEHLLQFGGHKYAAGLTMEEAAVPAFRQRFDEVVRATIGPESLCPVVEIDAELELGDITEKFYDIAEQMAPFGPGNRRPVFATRDVRDTGATRVVKEDHLKLEVFKPGQRNVRGIAFRMADRYEFIQRKTKFDVAYQLQLNEWNGYRNIEMLVKDVR